MSWGGIAVGVGGAVIGGISGNKAAKKQQQAAREANMLQMMQAAQLREDMSPWTKAGGAAHSELSKRLGLGGEAGDADFGSLLNPYRNGEEFKFTGEDLENEAGYKFGLDQGTQGINRGQAARGNFLSGAAMKELNRFSQDYAGTKFNDAFGRAKSTWDTNAGAHGSNQDRVFRFLQGVSGMGQNAAAGVGAGDMTAAGRVGENMLGAGNAGAAKDIATGDAWRDALNKGANAWNSRDGINSPGGWNSLISQGGSSYGGSSTIGGSGVSPPASNFGGWNGNINW